MFPHDQIRSVKWMWALLFWVKCMQIRPTLNIFNHRQVSVSDQGEKEEIFLWYWTVCVCVCDCVGTVAFAFVFVTSSSSCFWSSSGGRNINDTPTYKCDQSNHFPHAEYTRADSLPNMAHCLGWLNFSYTITKVHLYKWKSINLYIRSHSNTSLWCVPILYLYRICLLYSRLMCIFINEILLLCDHNHNHHHHHLISLIVYDHRHLNWFVRD